MDKIPEASPSRVLLAKEAKYVAHTRLGILTSLTATISRTEANFTHHPKSITKSAKVKLVRYQQNPLPNWGPGTKAKSGTGSKRKREPEGEEDQQPV